jgi:hypothetical protein
MSWQPELDELARRKAFAHEMGGADKVKRQHDGGRLTVRERIDGLLDAGSFQEVGTLSGIGEYDASNSLTTVTPANCVFGRGKVEGRPVVVVGDDFTVRGGSADASISAKPLMAEEMAEAFRLPIVRIIEGSGGGTSQIVFGTDVDTFKSSAIINDFDEGVRVDSAGQRINIGETAGLLESTGANDLRILGAGELYLDDGNQTGSTWAQTAGIKLSDTTQEWNDFEVALTSTY